MPLLKSDLYDILLSCVTEDLSNCAVEWSTNLSTCGVVMASGGYPGEYEKDHEISGNFYEECFSVSKITFFGFGLGLQSMLNCESALIFHAGTKKIGEQKRFLTCGGRVLTVVGLGSSLNEARENALSTALSISFKDCYYRKDIGAKSSNLANYSLSGGDLTNGLTYSSAGVSIEAGDKLVENIKKFCSDTSRSGSSSLELGGFGGLFDLKQAGYVDPILVSGTDGVGTKLKVSSF